MASGYTSQTKIMRKQSAADTPNIDATGATSEFHFAGGPVIVRRVGVDVTTAVVSDNSVACTATMSRRAVIGSTGTVVALGVFKIAAAGVDPAAGSVIYKDLAIADHDGESAEDYDADTSRATRNEAPNSNMTGPETGHEAYLILPGQSFVLTLDTNAEADSGAVVSWVEYEELPFTGPFRDGSNVSRDTSND